MTRMNNRLINIQNSKTGKVVRIKRTLADPLVDQGVWDYISNSEYKEALKPKPKLEEGK